MEQNGEVDVSLQEVFSERQRYGRVARYELRPSRFGQAAPSVPSFGEDQINSRRVPDFPLVRMILLSYNVSVSFPFKCNISKPQLTLSYWTPTAGSSKWVISNWRYCRLF